MFPSIFVATFYAYATTPAVCLCVTLICLSVLSSFIKNDLRWGDAYGPLVAMAAAVAEENISAAASTGAFISASSATAVAAASNTAPLSPSSLSALPFAVACSQAESGHFYPVGGYRALVDHLMATIRLEGGGLVLSKVPVAGIELEEGRAVGVRIPLSAPSTGSLLLS